MHFWLASLEKIALCGLNWIVERIRWRISLILRCKFDQFKHASSCRDMEDSFGDNGCVLERHDSEIFVRSRTQWSVWCKWCRLSTVLYVWICSRPTLVIHRGPFRFTESVLGNKCRFVKKTTNIVIINIAQRNCIVYIAELLTFPMYAL